MGLLVAAGPRSAAITAATGARVTVWRRVDAGDEPLRAGAVLPSESGLVDRVVTALAGVTAQHVLLVIGPAAGQLAPHRGNSVGDRATDRKTQA